MADTLNLHQRINRVCYAIENLQKKTQVGTGYSGYKAISAAQVISAVDPLMAKHGLTLLPVKQELGELTIREYTDGYGKAKIQFIQQSKFTYRLTNADDIKEFIDIESAAIGIDTLDKGTGKASTYALKTILCVIFRIPSGEDPDLIHSDDVEPSITKQPTPTTKQELDVGVGLGIVIGLCKDGKANEAYDAIATMGKVTRNSVLSMLRDDYSEHYKTLIGGDKWKTAMAKKQQGEK